MALKFSFTNINFFITQHADFIAGILLATLSASAIIFPRAIPFFYLFLALLAAIELWRTGKTSEAVKIPGLFWILISLFTVWCFVTILWSLVPLQAMSKVLFLTYTILAAWIIYRWLSTISLSMSQHLNSGLFIGFAIGTLFLTIETVLDQPIAKSFLNNFEFARPDTAKHIRIINNEVVNLPLYLLNRNIATLNILLWPTILFAVSQWEGKRGWIISGALFALVALVTFHSVHETSMTALLAGVVCFSLNYFIPRIGRIMMIAIWISALVFVIPVALKAYDANLHKAEWMPPSAQARIVLWSNTARSYMSNPILGVGVRTTQFIDDERVKKANNPRTDNHKNIGTARHGHNIYLQTWYELGAVGAILLLLSGLALLTRINRMLPQIKIFVLTTFGVAITIAAFTWGMWQVWYIAMFAFSSAAMLIASRQNIERNAPRQQ